jgi:signal transduction histidine kinase/putative methionine-R-sulfoxide reductase with GAF domain
MIWLLEKREDSLIVRATYASSPDLAKPFQGARESLRGPLGQLTLGQADSNLGNLDGLEILPAAIASAASQLEVKSALSVPLILEEKVVGVATILSREENRFPAQDRRLYGLLAHEAATAINNAQAHSQLKAQLAEITRLQHVSTQINSNLELPTVLLSLVKAVAEAAGTTKSWLTLLSTDGKELFHVAAYGLSDEFLQAFSAIPVGQGPCGLAVKERQVVVVADVDTEAPGEYFRSERIPLGFRSVCSVPLALKDGEIVGTFATFHSHPFRPTSDQIKMAGLYAQQAAIAIENARLYESVERQLHQMRALESVSERINRELELNATLQAAAESSRQALGADRCAIFLLDQVSGEVTCSVHEGLGEESISPVAQVFFEGNGERRLKCARPIGLTEPFPENQFEGLADVAEREGFKSILFLPLVYREKAHGSVILFYDEPRHFFEEEMKVGQVFANQVAIAMDNAKLYEAERARVIKLEQLDQLKSDFVSNVSHELRTPLTTIKGSLQTLLRGWEKLDEDRRHSYVAMCHDASGRLYRLVEDLLFVSRIESGRLDLQTEPVKIDPVLWQATRDIQGQHPDRTIETDIPACLPAVLADAGRVQQIILNLLDNAVKYSDGDTLVRLNGTVSSEDLTISVSDQGIGIGPQDMPRLFTKFGRVDRTIRARAGTGLGLFICKQLVEQMGGRIWVESFPGHGSTFFFSLRLAQDGDLRLAASSFPVPPPVDMPSGESPSGV